MIDTINDLELLAEKNCSRRRYEHIKSVERLAVKLAKIHGLEENSLRLAAIGHDVFREFSASALLKLAREVEFTPSPVERSNPILLHGKLAALYIRDRYLLPDDAFEAIYWHVSGHPDLGSTGIVLMICDMAEETRTFPEATIIREFATKDLEKSYLNVIRLKIEWAVKTRKMIVPETISTWNNVLGGISCGTN